MQPAPTLKTGSRASTTTPRPARTSRRRSFTSRKKTKAHGIPSLSISGAAGAKSRRASNKRGRRYSTLPAHDRAGDKVHECRPAKAGSRAVPAHAGQVRLRSEPEKAGITPKKPKSAEKSEKKLGLFSKARYKSGVNHNKQEHEQQNHNY